MKRYSFTIGGDEDSYLSPDGEWVKFEDVDKFYKITERNINIDVECNCEKMANTLKPMSTTPVGWICPAHGYKRI